MKGAAFLRCLATPIRRALEDRPVVLLLGGRGVCHSTQDLVGEGLLGHCLTRGDLTLLAAAQLDRQKALVDRNRRPGSSTSPAPPTSLP